MPTDKNAWQALVTFPGGINPVQVRDASDNLRSVGYRGPDGRWRHAYNRQEIPWTVAAWRPIDA